MTATYRESGDDTAPGQTRYTPISYELSGATRTSRGAAGRDQLWRTASVLRRRGSGTSIDVPLR
jgi:hypothetical protein